MSSPLSLKGAIKVQDPRRPDSDKFADLSPRQRLVLALFAMGWNTKRIALWLGVSPKTIENHRFRFYETTGYNCIADVTRFAIRTGIIKP